MLIKDFISIGFFVLPLRKILLLMIEIRTDEGCYFNFEDSTEYIKWIIQNNFKDMASFLSNDDVKKPSYWGDCIIHCTNNDFKEFICNLATTILRS